MGIAIAIGFIFLSFHEGGGKPSMKTMRKTKPMAMAMPMPILIGTFWYFFQKGSGPSSLGPSGLFRVCRQGGVFAGGKERLPVGAAFAGGRGVCRWARCVCRWAGAFVVGQVHLLFKMPSPPGRLNFRFAF